MRVLVIEDERELAKVLVQALREDGYAVDGSQDGEDGLYKAQNWDYDVIVLDLMIPRLTGWALLQELRRSKKTPVMILTARDAIGDRVRGLDLGADDYLVKPFDLAELLARVRALIRRSTGQVDPMIVVGDVQIDTRTKTITQAGVEVVLTAREYALVELLAYHKGRLVTRTQIYDHLFDMNEDSLSNLVEVHVSNIRRKLGKDFIETRRGQGYLLHG